MPGIPPSAVTATPTGLLTSTTVAGQVHLLIGGNPVAAARAQKSLDAGATVKVVTPAAGGAVHYALQRRIEEGAVEFVRRGFEDGDLTTLGRADVGGVVELVWVTEGAGELVERIAKLCRRLRIPVNVLDSPALSTFALLSTHSDGPLHIGVTTSGNGCKLASRIRREIAASLPPQLGEACTRIGKLRRRLIAEADGFLDGGEDEAAERAADFNALVTEKDEKTRRIRWLSQICEYWPLEKICGFEEAQLEEQEVAMPLMEQEKAGSILLVGSGPGHPDLLTVASKRALETADLVLADKLVPAAVLELIPRRTNVFIAKKFPGNADAAQEELLATGLAALKAGATVVRLKQGDPYIYGRGGEEFVFFAKHGYEPTVLPGVTSALSAPLFSQIPATHRGVADQVLLCTGTGRKGAPPNPPEWVPTRTTVFLMALHRIDALVQELKGKGWPVDTPCAVVERASCRDQRVVRTTLAVVGRALEELGSRPPGLLVVGKACGVLKSQQGPERGWVVEEGFGGF
ncbi:putative siroheme synthase [Sphaerosporella brunnea]|uniref:Putative siroheme synthase n=1 Tax=Sphaerosporella brunnea TaxID=1250544 RepID=A0A5J5FBE6_9PEZI|nr:putative siroheme synthase [Sphaerosporella brunnea]